MTEKLKPEHRKLWRRIYLIEYEQEHQTAEESQKAADKVVAQWEARGAFDEPSDAHATTTMSIPSIAEQFTVRFPSDALSIWDDVERHHLQNDLRPAPCDDREAFAMAAFTPRGHYLLYIGYKDGVAAMRRAMPTA